MIATYDPSNGSLPSCLLIVISHRSSLLSIFEHDYDHDIRSKQWLSPIVSLNRDLSSIFASSIFEHDYDHDIRSGQPPSPIVIPNRDLLSN